MGHYVWVFHGAARVAAAVGGGCWLLAAGSWLCTGNYRELPAVIGIPGNSPVITKPIFSYQEIARLYA